MQGMWSYIYFVDTSLIIIMFLHNGDMLIPIGKHSPKKGGLKIID